MAFSDSTSHEYYYKGNLRELNVTIGECVCEVITRHAIVEARFVLEA